MNRVLLPLLVALVAARFAVAESPPGHAYTLPSDPRHVLWAPAGFDPDGGKADVLVAFHMAPPLTRRSVRQAGSDGAVVNVTYGGLSSVYRRPFAADRRLFQRVLDEALSALRRHTGEDLEWGRVRVASFSAGFGAVREVLKTEAYFDRIDAVLLADSLYCGYVGDGAGEVQQGVVHPGLMKDFLRFAQAACEGEKTMVVTHCVGPTPGYASTLETADYLLEHLRLAPRPIDTVLRLPDQKEADALTLYRTAEREGFLLYGSPGPNETDHVKHLRHLESWLRELPRE